MSACWRFTFSIHDSLSFISFSIHFLFNFIIGIQEPVILREAQIFKKNKWLARRFYSSISLQIIYGRAPSIYYPLLVFYTTLSFISSTGTVFVLCRYLLGFKELFSELYYRPATRSWELWWRGQAFGNCLVVFCFIIIFFSLKIVLFSFYLLIKSEKRLKKLWKET